MVINLRKVLTGVENPISFQYTADFSDYDLFGAKPFTSGLHVDGTITNRSGYMSLNLDLSAQLEFFCASCGIPLVLPFEVSTEHVLAKEPSDENTIQIYGDEIDVSPIVLEDVNLNMEMRPLCRKDCKGLCLLCGTNLNDAECSCEKLGNTAFESLKEKFPKL